MSDSNLRARVCADLAAGATLLAAATDHGISAATAARWFDESRLTRKPLPTQPPMTEERRKAIVRMLGDGRPLREICARLRCGKPAILAVRRAMREGVVG